MSGGKPGVVTPCGSHLNPTAISGVDPLHSARQPPYSPCAGRHAENV